MTLLELAAMCEKAEGPDRELDCLIAPVAGWVEVRYSHPSVRSCIGPDGKKYAHGLIAWAPAYTASIDAALTLVDDELVTVVMREALDRLDRRFSPMDNYLAKLRLFVCAAALRARAATEDRHDQS